MKIKNKKIIIILSLCVLFIGILYLSLHIIAAFLFSPNIMPFEGRHHAIHTKIRDYYEQIDFIFELSNKFQIIEIGTIEYPNYPSYQMYKVSYGNPNNNEAVNLLFMCGLHGNEIAPVYAMKDFILFLDSIDLMDNINIDFYYIVNPFGFENHCRFNIANLDINSDFVAFNTQEANFFVNSLRNVKYTGVYDFHEHGATEGFMLYYYLSKNKTKALSIIEMLEHSNIPLENEFVDYRFFRAKNGLLQIPFYGRLFSLHFMKRSTVEIYFVESLKTSEVFCFETPYYSSMPERINTHLLIMKSLIGL